ncbi:endolytic transglycosylase MltG [Candidatus Aerophobetes bacterium]|nr:endolytic transglycosylase MltG [Candidatus Aerophobetes bacterium]
MFFLIILIVSYFFIPSFSRKKVLIRIPPGVTSTQISYILKENKIITNPYFFSLMVKILKYDTSLKAGVYEFTSPTFFSVVDKLLKGKVKTYRVTFPEGLPKWEVANLLAEKQIVDRQNFLQLVDNAEYFYQRFPWLDAKDSLEGYLFPDTYDFVLEENPVGVVGKFLTKFEQTILPLYHKMSRDNALSLHELIILASIIEKEAVVSFERPMIAGVFYNRLNRGMRLRADPTVKYALGSFNVRLDTQMLIYPSPYNTYIYSGLPPGPICSPGVDSIKAALEPAQVNYLYFVSRKDGTHEFSTTYQEHLQAIEKYQLGYQGG